MLNGEVCRRNKRKEGIKSFCTKTVGRPQNLELRIQTDVQTTHTTHKQKDRLKLFNALYGV
jgi:hypothetical protein